jgi:protein phosphatase PTC7
MKYDIAFIAIAAHFCVRTSAFVQPRVDPFVSHETRHNNRQFRLYGGLEPLATEGDWTAYLDEKNTGLVYYFNGKTGVSVWEKPSTTFPDVVLKGSMKRAAAEKQKEYLKSVADSNPNLKKGFFQTIMDASTADATTTTEVKKEDNDWFSPIYEQTTTATTSTTGSTAIPAVDQKNVEEQIEIKSDSGNGWKIGSMLDTPQIEKPKEKGFFDSIFGSGTKDEKLSEEPSKIQAKDAEKAIDVGGFLGSMFKAATSTFDSTDATATNIDDLVPAPSTTTTTTPTTAIKIESAAYVLPHPSKIFWGGEDAVFVKGRTFGVFDGVSGAKKLDGIPLYSKTLANEMKRLIPNDKTALSTPDLTRILSQCAETANQIATGASTAVVASIGDDGFLRAVNVGDSTCIVIRNGKVVAKTREISHYFECPYQLSVDSPDKPRDGTKLNVELMPGDIIFMASDGVFDNLSETEVAEMVVKEKQLSQMAKRVSDMSRKVSQDRNAKTPYAKQAQKYGDPDYQSGLGGKLDDVSCVVVAYG